MKRILTLLSMIVTLALSSQANYYLVGQAPFGNGWEPSNGLEMTRNDDGTYSVKGTIMGTIYFFLADNLAAPGDWVTFNNEYRIGPIDGDQQVFADNWVQTQKSKGDNGAYMFVGSGDEYTLIFDPVDYKFIIESTMAPPYDCYTVAGMPKSVFGTQWDASDTNNDMIKQEDGTYMLTKPNCYIQVSAIEFKIVRFHDWLSSWPADNYVLPIEEVGTYDITFTFNPETQEVGASAVKSGGNAIKGDVNGDGEVNISDINSIIDIILGN